ncbi:photosynthetic complex assembly protein PuhC [Meridianimarinicoccus aquatilis]|uniref:Pullulanase n=1 Tax=Meridianimarinicoccus aquatilis TaxID=2552766 RepID=A0A4R6ATL9_9RHOB|nr:photosynthetic complex assembly protein PuhC [Fluviibacterium aquatile]TDL86058.1 pullulanase [Fluviibacterium aquatile]
MAFSPENQQRTTMDDAKVPTFLVKTMFGMVLLCLTMVTAHTLLDRPLVATPPTVPAAQERVLYLDGTMGGAATVSAQDGTVIADLSSEEGGFVAGIWRVLQRERAKFGVASDGPVTLVRGTNGRLSLYDPSTNWRADLMGFGAGNARTFARLLD